MRPFVIFAAGVLLALSAHAAAQDLPTSVTEPYVRYEQAMEAQDFAVAETAADLAWRAAEDAEIDIVTTGLLADNYAQLAHRAGNYSEAVRAYMRSAEILTELQDDPLLIAQTWRLAAQSAFMGGDHRRAESLADDAGDILAGLPRTREREIEFYRARLIQAYVEWESGRLRPAGRRAVEAVESLEAAGGPANSDTANLFFYAAVRYANERENLEAAYYFSVASYIWRTMEVEANTRMITEEWARYARSQLDDDDLAMLVERLAASPYRTEPSEAYSGTEGRRSWRDDYPDAQEFSGGMPSQRRPPQYPTQMAYAGLEGVALMMFDVNEEGRTENIRVLYTVPRPEFGDSATDAVRRWRYEPALVDGRPVARRDVVTTIEYRMME